MIGIKTKDEIAKMKQAGLIVAKVHQEFAKVVKPGISTRDLDKIAHKIITENGAKPSFLNYHGYPATVCASVNDVLVHGIPNGYKLKEGDIISLDVGAEFEGYHGDSAWTYAVGKIDKQSETLMDVTRDSLYAGLAQVRAGVHLSDVSHAIESHVKKFGFSVPEDYTGHGIGSELHEDPVIYNYGPKGEGPILKAGMTLAIEPMVNVGKKHTTLLKDNWTVKVSDGTRSAHYEHTVLVTEKGCQILTSLDQEELVNG